MGFIEKALENLVSNQLPATMSNSPTNNDRKRRLYLKMKVIAEFTVHLENPNLAEEVRKQLQKNVNDELNFVKNIHKPTANEINTYIWESKGISGENITFDQLLVEFVKKCREKREKDQQRRNNL